MGAESNHTARAEFAGLMAFDDMSPPQLNALSAIHDRTLSGDV